MHLRNNWSLIWNLIRCQNFQYCWVSQHLYKTIGTIYKAKFFLVWVVLELDLLLIIIIVCHSDLWKRIYILYIYIVCVWHRGSKPVTFCFGFLFNHILHCICFKILFTVQNILFLTEVIFRLIRTLRKWKISNKKIKIFRVIIILCNHYFILLKLFWTIKGFILYQVNQKH